MFKVLLALLLMITPSWAITNFSINVPTSASDLKSNFPAEATSQWTIFQMLLQNYRQGCFVTYNNSLGVNISSGEVTVWNGTSALFLQNTGTTTATATNLDTGSSFTASTTYYVYAGTSTVTAQNFVVTLSLNNTAPSGVTYYKQLGNFTTDSSGNIGEIVDYNQPSRMGTVFSRTSNTVYQASTDGFVTGYCSVSNGALCVIDSDQSPSPSTVKSTCQSNSSMGYSGICAVFSPIKKGDYYFCSGQGTTCTSYFIQQGQ